MRISELWQKTLLNLRLKTSSITRTGATCSFANTIRVRMEVIVFPNFSGLWICFHVVYFASFRALLRFFFWTVNDWSWRIETKLTLAGASWKYRRWWQGYEKNPISCTIYGVYNEISAWNKRCVRITFCCTLLINDVRQVAPRSRSEMLEVTRQQWLAGFEVRHD